MTVCGKLLTPPSYHKAYRALLAAAYSGAHVELVDYVPSSTLPEGFSKCPIEAAPLFCSEDGVVLFEANAIAHYLGTKQLRGDDEEHFVTQWANFTDNVLLPSIAAWYYPIIGATNYDKQSVSKGEENVKKAMAYMNEYLSTRTFLVSEHVTQGDLTAFTALRMVFENLLDEAGRKHYPNLTRWYTTIANQPEVKRVCGDMHLCASPITYQAKAALKHSGGKICAKPQQPRSQEPKGDKADEDAPRRSKNPLANLPVGSFIYDEFKRIYSNEDIEKVAIPFFWEKFDPTTDSIWYSEYKYNDELKFTFMSANLLRGMFQRLEKMQKFSFAIMNVYGENNKSTIAGLWVWRGTDLIFEKSEDLQTDYESYTWTKLDPNAPETKKRVEEYFLRGDTCEGKPVAENLVFK